MQPQDPNQQPLQPQQPMHQQPTEVDAPPQVTGAQPVAQQPAPPQPHQFQPVQPGVVPQQTYQQSSQGIGDPAQISQQNIAPASFPTESNKSSVKKKILIALGGVIAVVVVLFVIIFISLLPKKVIQYAQTDLKTASSTSYTFSYPSQWEDLSSKEDFVKQLGLSGEKLSEIKVYGYGYNKTRNAIQVAQLTGISEFPVTDSQLIKVLSDPVAKKEFEKSIKSSAASMSYDGANCSIPAGSGPDVTYNTPKYVTQLSVAYECKLSEEQKVNYGSDTLNMAMVMGIKNNKSFINVVVSEKKDWAKNQDFYKTSLVTSISPK